MNRLSRAAAMMSALGLALFLSACGGDDNPGTPVPPTTQPSAAPTTPPPPSPALPGQASCSRIGLGTFNENCGRFAPNFDRQVEEAIDLALRQKPHIFEGSGNNIKVISPGQFYVAVIENLDAMGICADFDGEEIQVKDSNALNDQYHIVTSNFLVRRGESKYRATCSPASFPTPAPPLNPTPNCRLAPSRSLTCTDERPNYLGDVDRAIAQVAREHPEVFDFTRHQPGTDWFKIVDHDRYFEYMVQTMTSYGYCAIYDGEELAIKTANDFNEQYDIFAGDGFVRRGLGSYRSTCYPATF